MIAVNQIVLVFFKLVNFSVLIGLAWYLFKKYGLPGIQQNAIEHRAQFEGLAHTHHHLKREQQTLEQQIVKDRKDQDVLKERLMRWRAQVDDANKKLLLEKEERKNKLQELIALQQKQITQHRIFAIVMPEAIIEARTILQEKAHNESAQYKIFDAALVMMRRQ